MIYIHTGCVKGKGALKVFRDQYLVMNHEEQEKLKQIYILQPSTYLKVRIFIKAKLCFGKEAKQLNISKFNK